MREFIEVKVTESEAELDRLMKSGWELFSTTTYLVVPKDQRVKYHLGLPAKVKIEQLKEIIIKYEELGFKEQLFAKIAEENGESMEGFSYSGGRPLESDTANFIQRYEELVHDKQVRIYKKIERKNTNIEDIECDF
ncbi:MULTISPECIES: hypothetical protein [Bacillus]|uniref:hypothetical protein n=1 Tax=Bacillus TaxID=1386 RepID=UPI001239E7E5|nr:hypothetical protein [Bacillus swezeyi]KAA6475747.1 hypothetical protein DX928_06470 [Bacillus swezeyi]